MRLSIDRGLLISGLVSLLAGASAIGGFWIGHQRPPASFADKFRQIIAVETQVTSFHEAISPKISDPVTMAALSKIFGIEDRAALEDRLRSIPFVPPYRFSPFVGHMARPVDSPGLHINAEGFRDIDRDYSKKAPDTVRVFITGGSSAWGSGSVQEDTVAAGLERILNQRVSPSTRRRYEVVNAAFPAWASTQEKILIQQRIVDMRPDVIIMLSGTNDVHWTLFKRDVRWFFSYYDQNYLAIINEMHKSDGHPERSSPDTVLNDRLPCSEVGKHTARNIKEAAFAAQQVNARLVFALQPNMNSTGKRLTAHERSYYETQDHELWKHCYPAIRDAALALQAPNYAMLDLSTMFSEFGADEELFIDSYHLTARANLMVAEALVAQIDWSNTLTMRK